MDNCQVEEAHEKIINIPYANHYNRQNYRKRLENSLKVEMLYILHKNGV